MAATFALGAACLLAASVASTEMLARSTRVGKSGAAARAYNEREAGNCRGTPKRVVRRESGCGRSRRRLPVVLTSSRCERTELALGGLCSAEPRFGEPWPPFGRSHIDGLRLRFVGLAGRLARRCADARERQARRLLSGRALLD